MNSFYLTDDGKQIDRVIDWCKENFPANHQQLRKRYNCYPFCERMPDNKVMAKFDISNRDDAIMFKLRWQPIKEEYYK